LVEEHDCRSARAHTAMSPSTTTTLRSECRRRGVPISQSAVSGGRDMEMRTPSGEDEQPRTCPSKAGWGRDGDPMTLAILGGEPTIGNPGVIGNPVAFTAQDRDAVIQFMYS